MQACNTVLYILKADIFQDDKLGFPSSQAPQEYGFF